MTRHRMRERRKKQYAEREKWRQIRWIIRRGGQLYMAPDVARAILAMSTPAPPSYGGIPFHTNRYMPPGMMIAMAPPKPEMFGYRPFYTIIDDIE